MFATSIQVCSLKALDSDRRGFELQLCHLVTVWPYTSHLHSPLPCKMGITRFRSKGKLDNTRPAPHMGRAQWMRAVSIFISYWTTPCSFQLTTCNSSFPDLPASSSTCSNPPSTLLQDVTQSIYPSSHFSFKHCPQIKTLRLTAEALQTQNRACPPIQPLIAMSDQWSVPLITMCVHLSQETNGICRLVTTRKKCSCNSICRTSPTFFALHHPSGEVRTILRNCSLQCPHSTHHIQKAGAQQSHGLPNAYLLSYQREWTISFQCLLMDFNMIS